MLKSDPRITRNDTKYRHATDLRKNSVPVRSTFADGSLRIDSGKRDTMNKKLPAIFGAIVLVALFGIPAFATEPDQQQPVVQRESRFTRVVVTGDSIVQAQPDTAILNIAVVTQGKRALDAQQENATRSDAVIRSLKAAVGAGAEIKTSGYSLQPIRVYKEGQPPLITGYEARNSVTVILSDLTKVGPVIDAAGASGANDVTGIAFTLRKDRPARDQALADATREAVSKAQVIAQALNGRIVRIAEVQEEGTQRPRPVYDSVMQMRVEGAASTPIEVGTLDITSRVQLIAEIETIPR
jgi:uncharacterized protein YggE